MKTEFIGAIFGALLFGTLHAQGPSSPNPAKRTTTKTDQTWVPDKSNPSSKVDELEQKVAQLETRIWLLENSGNTIWLDPAVLNKYQRIKTNNGDFLITIAGVEPYLDGVKVALSIGNPYSANFSGFSLEIEWGSRMPKDLKNYTEWNKSLTKKKFDFTESLSAGTWNRVVCILPSMKPDQFGYLSLSMTTDVINMNRIPYTQ